MASRFPSLETLRNGVTALGKRKLIIGAGVLGIAGISTYALVKPKPKPPVSVVGYVPPLGHHAGSRNNTQSAYDQHLMADQDRLAAIKAGKTGKSYAGPFGQALANHPVRPASSPATVVAVAQKITPHPVATDPPSTGPSRPPLRGTTEVQPQGGSAATGAYDQARYTAYNNEIAAVMGQFGGTPPATSVLITPAVAPTDPKPALGSPGAGMRAAGDPASRMPFGSPRHGGRILIPAGHGVYGVTKLSVSSDQPGSPVEVEALSGPIAGDDMIGSFSAAGDRLVVKLNQITLKNGQQASINALVVTPDTMKTAVATSVNEHYVSRIVLPAAAAFVEALGGSLGQSGSVEQTSPLGGLTVFSHVNTAQAVAAGVGNAANTVGQVFAQDAPKGPTVKLADDTDVGVLFLSPLKAPAP
jgi:hypothetical protein